MPCEDAPLRAIRMAVAIRTRVQGRAEEWARRNRRAFLASYCGEGGLTDTDKTLLTAYVLDKAVYECLYEARNRPAWLTIPLRAVTRLAGEPTPG